MVEALLICILLSSANDSLPQVESSATRSYSKQILINGIIGVGFTIGAGVFYTKGNGAYEEYEKSESMGSALENWDKVQLYDNVRNVCAIGALLFFGRALYYQLKNVKVSSSRSEPVNGLHLIIDIEYVHQPKLLIGMSKDL